MSQNSLPSVERYDNTLMEKIAVFVDKHDGIYGIDIDSPLNDILNAPITYDEVTLSLKKTKCNKAAGIDGMPAELYKYSGGTINDCLVALFNKIFDCGYYPDQW